MAKAFGTFDFEELRRLYGDEIEAWAKILPGPVSETDAGVEHLNYVKPLMDKMTTRDVAARLKILEAYTADYVAQEAGIRERVKHYSEKLGDQPLWDTSVSIANYRAQQAEKPAGQGDSAPQTIEAGYKTGAYGRSLHYQNEEGQRTEILSSEELKKLYDKGVELHYDQFFPGRSPETELTSSTLEEQVDDDPMNFSETVHISSISESPDGKHAFVVLSPDLNNDSMVGMVIDLKTGEQVDDSSVYGKAITARDWSEDGSTIQYAYHGREIGDDTIYYLVRNHTVGQSFSVDETTSRSLARTDRIDTPYVKMVPELKDGMPTGQKRAFVVSWKVDYLSAEDVDADPDDSLTPEMRNRKHETLYMAPLDENGQYNGRDPENLKAHDLNTVTTTTSPADAASTVTLAAEGNTVLFFEQSLEYPKGGVYTVDIVTGERNNILVPDEGTRFMDLKLNLEAPGGPKFEAVIHDYTKSQQHVAVYDLNGQRLTTPFEMDGPCSVREHEIDYGDGQGTPEIMANMMTYQNVRHLVRHTDEGTETIGKGQGFMDMGDDFVAKTVEIEASDGETITVDLVYPKNMPPEDMENAAMVTYAYGGFQSHDNPSMLEPVRALMKEGHSIFAFPHPRGSMNEGMDWSLGGYAQNKQQTFDDVNDAVEALHKMGYSQPARTFLTGSSHGGTVAFHAGLQRQDLYGAIIPRAGIQDIANAHLGRSYTMNVTHKHGKKDGNYEYGRVWDSKDVAAMKAASPMQDPDGYKAGPDSPIVLLHTGVGDERVPVHHTAAAAGFLIELGYDVLLSTNASGGHFLPNADADRAEAMHVAAGFTTLIEAMLGPLDPKEYVLHRQNILEEESMGPDLENNADDFRAAIPEGLEVDAQRYPELAACMELLDSKPLFDKYFKELAPDARAQLVDDLKEHIAGQEESEAPISPEPTETSITPPAPATQQGGLKF